MRPSDQSAWIRFGDTIKAFLSCPTNKRKFRAFYSICFDQTIAYLRFLRGQGWSIPIEKTESENPLADIAVDILGGLLQSRPDAPFFMIFDYYKRHGITSPEASDPKELSWLLSVLIRGFTKKELGKLNIDRDAGVENLKRRFKDILRGDEYGRIAGAAPNSELIFYREYESDLRPDKPLPPMDQLREVVDKTFAAAKSRNEWCREIFKALNSLRDIRNGLILGDLLKAVVAVNAEHIELYGWRPAAMPSPEISIVESSLREARQKASELVKTSNLSKFRLEGRITESEADQFLLAVEQYLIDLGRNGQTDSVPEYFRLVMPQSTHGDYLKRYKYIFETVLNQAVEEFRRILKE